MNSIPKTVALLALLAISGCGGSGPSTPPDDPTPTPAAPVLLTVTPDSISVTDDSAVISVEGHGFDSSSVILWNGAHLATELVDSTMLTAVVQGSRIAHGVVAVQVTNPAPGGGPSESRSVSVYAPSPISSYIAQDNSPVGQMGYTLDVFGDAFMRASVLLWGDSVLSTTRVSSRELKASIPPGLMSFDTTITIRVRTPEPGGGTSGPLPFTIVPDVRIRTYDAVDMISDLLRDRLIIATTATSGSFPNSLVLFSAPIGEVTNVILEGVYPGKMAISPDYSTLFVELGTNGDVGIIDLQARRLLKTFSLGSDPDYGPLRVDDMAVVPGAPHSVVISLQLPNLSPRHRGVAIFDDGVQRGAATPVHTGPTSLAFAGSADRVYGIEEGAAEGNLFTIELRASGPVVTGVRPATLWGNDLWYSDGLFYAGDGNIVDAATLAHVGSFTDLGVYTPALAVDSANGRAFFFRSGGILRAYALSTQQALGSLTIPDLQWADHCKPLQRTGRSGLALSCPGAIYLVRSRLVEH